MNPELRKVIEDALAEITKEVAVAEAAVGRLTAERLKQLEALKDAQFQAKNLVSAKTNLEAYLALTGPEVKDTLDVNGLTEPGAIAPGDRR